MDIFPGSDKKFKKTRQNNNEYDKIIDSEIDGCYTEIKTDKTVLSEITLKDEEIGIMFTEERQSAIEKCLREKGKVKVKELSEKFQVTEDCIRKDLKTLEMQVN